MEKLLNQESRLPLAKAKALWHLYAKVFSTNSPDSSKALSINVFAGMELRTLSINLN